MKERRSERRSAAVANASQTRPDQTRVLVTEVCGSQWSLSKSKVTVTYGSSAAPIGFGEMG